MLLQEYLGRKDWGREIFATKITGLHQSISVLSNSLASYQFPCAQIYDPIVKEVSSKYQKSLPKTHAVPKSLQSISGLSGKNCKKERCHQGK